MEERSFVQALLPQRWHGKPLNWTFYAVTISTILTKVEITCSSSDEGIARLRQAHRTLIAANSELEKTNILLESEDEILSKVPPFTRDQVEVTLPP